MRKLISVIVLLMIPLFCVASPPERQITNDDRAYSDINMKCAVGEMEAELSHVVFVQFVPLANGKNDSVRRAMENRADTFRHEDPGRRNC